MSRGQAVERPRFLLVATALALLLFVVPLVVVLVYSFNASRSLVNFDGFSTRWYSAAIHDADIRSSLVSSVEIAVLTTVVSGVLGTALALGLTRGHRALAAPTQGAVLVRLLAPETAIAVALLLMFSQVGLELSLFTIVLGHVALCIPFVAVIVSSRLASINPELEDAAMDLGATRLGALRLEVLPLLWPAIAGASVLTFVISFDNFITTFFTAGVDDVPLPLRIYSMLRFGVTPIVNAVGVLMTVVTVGGALLAFVLLRMARRNAVTSQRQEALT